MSKQINDRPLTYAENATLLLKQFYGTIIMIFTIVNYLNSSDSAGVLERSNYSALPASGSIIKSVSVDISGSFQKSNSVRSHQTSKENGELFNLLDKI